jgi:hypothetical protein
MNYNFPQIIMHILTTENVSEFTCEEWLSKTKGHKRTMVCEMAAVVEEEEMVESTTYIIQVKTSDIGGGSDKQHILQSSLKSMFM